MRTLSHMYLPCSFYDSLRTCFSNLQHNEIQKEVCWYLCYFQLGLKSRIFARWGIFTHVHMWASAQPYCFLNSLKSKDDRSVWYVLSIQKVIIIIIERFVQTFDADFEPIIDKFLFTLPKQNSSDWRMFCKEGQSSCWNVEGTPEWWKENTEIPRSSDL